MRLALTHAFAATPDRVHAMFTDTAFLDYACRALEADEFSTQASPEAAVVIASVAAPEVVRRFVGERMGVREEFGWGASAPDGSRDGTLSLVVSGAPVRLMGTLRLTPTASGSEFAVDADFTVAIPLLGATIEKAAAPDVADLLEVQAALGDSWLASHGGDPQAQPMCG